MPSRRVERSRRRPSSSCAPRALNLATDNFGRNNADAYAHFAADPRFDSPKGEIVILVGPGTEKAASADDVDAALREALSRLPLGEAASEVAKAFGLSRKDLYRQALALKEAAG